MPDEPSQGEPLEDVNGEPVDASTTEPLEEPDHTTPMEEPAEARTLEAKIDPPLASTVEMPAIFPYGPVARPQAALSYGAAGQSQATGPDQPEDPRPYAAIEYGPAGGDAYLPPAGGSAPPTGGGEGGYGPPVSGYKAPVGGGYGPPSADGTPPAPQAPRNRRFRRVVAAVAAAAIMLFAGAALGHQVWPSDDAGPSISQTQPGTNGPGQGDLPFGNGGSGSSDSGSNSSATIDVDGIAAKVNPALVDLNVGSDYTSGQGAATGIVLSSDGLVLTSNHVIDGMTDIRATDVGNGQTYSATVLGYDVSHDIALLQLQDASGLATADIGDSSGLSVGQAVVGLGNAGGEGGTPDAVGGSITALDQQIVAGDQRGDAEQLSGLIQTDAAIRSGDSGGPLVNTDGEVIGVLAAASATSGSSYYPGTGEGYAVPINTAMDIVDQIKNGESSDTVHVGETAFLGVSITDGSQGGYGGGYGDPYGYGGNGSGNGSGNGGQSGTTSGAIVAGVASGSPAEKTGLTAGDVIVSVDGQTVETAQQLSDLIATYHPGDTVSVTWTDQSGAEQTQTVELAVGPPK